MPFSREQKTRIQEHVYTARWLSFPDLPPNEHFLTSLSEISLHLVIPCGPRVFRLKRGTKCRRSSTSLRESKPHGHVTACHTPLPPAVQGKNAVSKATATLCFIDAAGKQLHVHTCKHTVTHQYGHTKAGTTKDICTHPDTDPLYCGSICIF